jgi:Mrp family chromosome partitioning ATPase
VAVVAVRPVVTDPFTYPGPGADRVVNMTVEEGLATGTEVVDAVAAATGDSKDDARDGLTVELPVGSQVLRFRYVERREQQSIAGANAAAATYLRVRQDIYQRQRDALVGNYDASIKSLSAERDAIRKTLPTTAPTTTSATPPATTASLDRLRALNDQLSQLTDKRVQAAAIDVTPGTVVRTAGQPVTSSHESGALYAVAAVLGGFLFGAVAAFALEAIDRRVRSASDAAAASGLPVLAEVRGRRRLRRDRGRTAADLRYLALAVLGQLGPVPHRGVVPLSTRARDGVDGVVGALAVAFAEQGTVVRWRDLTADGAQSLAALRAAATGQVAAPPEPAAPAADVPVIPGAEEDPDKTETLPRMTPVLLEQRARAAEPAALRVGPGQIWLTAPSEQADTMITVVRAGPADHDEQGVRAALEAAAVIVVRRDRTSISDLERLSGRLRLTGVRCLGVVVVSGRV